MSAHSVKSLVFREVIANHHRRILIADDSASPNTIRRLVGAARSADLPSSDPDDPLVRGFAEFGLPSYSSFTTDDRLRDLEAWRKGLQIPANSAFLDGTLLLTIEALLGPHGPDVLTPATLWDLTAFIDALVCFDRLYCIANPAIDVSSFNRRLGADILTAIPDVTGGTLRKLAAEAAVNGVSNIATLREHSGRDDVFAQEIKAVVEGWRTVLGPDIPSDGPFDDRLLRRLLYRNAYKISTGGLPPRPSSAAAVVEGLSHSESAAASIHWLLLVLIESTRLPKTPGESADRPTLSARREFAATATFRIYVNQSIANALALPYLPATLRVPFRRFFVERAVEV
jgi:hypothetical protein